MAKRSLLGVLLGVGLVGLGLGVAAACSNYTPPDVPSYGPPDELAGKTPPAPVGGDDGGGTVTPPEDGGGTTGPQTAYACEEAGAPLVDGSACTTSFANDIFPKMAAGGTWGCAGTANGCHGSAAAVKPYLQASAVAQTAAGFYPVLANFVLLDNSSKPYFNPCSTDPTQSSFVCNTLATGTTGECGISMPTTPGTTISAADQATVAAWVACGAPNN